MNFSRCFYTTDFLVKGLEFFLKNPIILRELMKSRGNLTISTMAGKEVIRTYFQKDHIEKAFRYLRGNACLAPIGYQLPNRVEAYLSVVNFISYELIAAILWKIQKFKIGISYENLMEKASKIFEVEFTSKDSKLYRWTHISKEDEKLFKPFNIFSVRS